MFLGSEASPHIPENCPFRVQTKLNHIILHTFIPSLPPSTITSHPATTTFLQADTQSSPLLHSTCPNHLNLPASHLILFTTPHHPSPPHRPHHLIHTTSSTQSTLLHIHLNIIPSHLFHSLQTLQIGFLHPIL